MFRPHGAFVSHILPPNCCTTLHHKVTLNAWKNA
jgi:hypothetical protein